MLQAGLSLGYLSCFRSAYLQATLFMLQVCLSSGYLLPDEGLEILDLPPLWTFGNRWHSKQEITSIESLQRTFFKAWIVCRSNETVLCSSLVEVGYKTIVNLDKNIFYTQVVFKDIFTFYNLCCLLLLHLFTIEFLESMYSNRSTDNKL